MSPRKVLRPIITQSPRRSPDKEARKHSRGGCRTCKARKVKCDERRPLCSHCARLSLWIDSCDFDPLPPGSKPSAVVKNHAVLGNNVSITTRQRVNKLPSPFNDASQKLLLHASNGRQLQPALTYRPAHSSDSFHALELRLMHHYTLNTCLELPDREDYRGKEIWRVDVPKMAFDCDFTLSAMLSLSALHLASLSPSDQSLVDACFHYFGKSVAQYRTAMVKPQANNAAPLVVTALLTALHVWISSYYTASDAVTPATTYLQCCTIIQGGLEMFSSMQHWLRDTEYEWFWEDSLFAEPCNSAPTPFLTAYQESLNLLLATLNETVSVEDRETYEKTARYLNQICRAMTSGCPQRRVQWYTAMMPMNLPRKYTVLLAKRDPRALVLWAHNNALVFVLDYAWWLHGPKGNNVMSNRLRDTFNGMPPNWQFLMKWPMEVVFGNPKTGI